MTPSLKSKEEQTKHTGNLINGTYEEFLRSIFDQNGAKRKWLMFLQEFQQLRSDLYKARQDVASLNQKLCHARRNLEDEKRKRRAVEQQRDLLEGQINMTKEILFHNEEADLGKEIKKKLQFLNNKPIIKNRYNNLYNQGAQNDGQLNTIMEMDSTGSILSDLNCLSKSEDDLDANAILAQIQKQREWKEHKPSCEYITKKQPSTLDKVAKFNSSDRPTAAIIKSDSGATADTATLRTQIVSNNVDSKILNVKLYADHSFVSKMVIKPETCAPCGKKIRFGKVVSKCKDCPIICHTECKTDAVLHPCTCK